MTTAPFPPEVLVIDDEVQIRRLLRLTLEGAGFRVREAEDGNLGLVEAATKRPDAIILDLGLPDLPGIEVLKRLAGVEPAACAHPFSPRPGGRQDRGPRRRGRRFSQQALGGGELLARLRAMLRRVQTREEESGVSFGDVEIDFARRVVMKAGTAVKLTPKEYGLLRLLVLHRGRVITHRQILRELWGPKAEEQTQYLRVYMTHLRQKLENDPTQPKFFRTESGIGYRFSEE